MKIIDVSARSCTVLLDEQGDYYARAPWKIFLNDAEITTENRAVFSLFDLWPDADYTLTAISENGDRQTLSFHTQSEFCTLNVRRFGAKGDGVADDTAAIQAAILCCPTNGRVMLPAGTYRTGPLFLKSHMTLEIKSGATLALLTDRARFPILPGMTRTTDEESEYLLGSWEGNPLDSFAAALTGIDVEDVRIIGQGVVDGRAQDGDWWADPKVKRGAFRGRLLFLRNCRNITVQGLTFRNSPAWNLHPCFSENLRFLNVRVEAPAASPNTDGFDPESCKNVRVYGALFSVGDDCIAIKSGKIYMGRKYRTPCQDIEIAWCAMLDGHGGVTIGSEMSGGVRNVRVRHCLMKGNDRGLRVKTRRGRGSCAVVDDIVFSDVRMDGVKTPLVVNCMYFCDPDGRSPAVQTREKRPVDDTAPTIGEIRFERVQAENCQGCAGYILGLPEKPVEQVTLRDCRFSFAADAAAMIPAMAADVPLCRRRGLIAQFVQRLTLENVAMEHIDGERMDIIMVETVTDK